MTEKEKENKVEDVNRVEEPSVGWNPANYTYTDYLQSGIDKAFEVIRGHVMKMSPSPNSLHQRIQRNLVGEFHPLFKRHQCEVFGAPYDVVLPVRNETRDTATTIVQPDLCVICDHSKIEAKCCVGPPDLVVEILSPSGVKRDVKDKYSIYEEAGVKEYWLVFPEYKYIEVFILKDGKYELHGRFIQGSDIQSPTFSIIDLSLKEIFPDLN